jgi:hypothetical protein
MKLKKLEFGITKFPHLKQIIIKDNLSNHVFSVHVKDYFLIIVYKL